MKVMDGLLVIFALLMVLSIYRLQRDETSVFNLLDLVMENGRLSRLACAFVVTLVITSWLMVRLALDGKLTEGYFMAYGGMWVAGIIAKMFGTTAVSSSTTFQSTTNTIPSPPAAPLPPSSLTLQSQAQPDQPIVAQDVTVKAEGDVTVERKAKP